MYREISKLVMFRNFGEGSILNNVCEIVREAEALQNTSGSYKGTKLDGLVLRAYGEVRRLLDLGTDYGFDKNLWRDYLTSLLINNENPFSLTCEKVGASD